MENARTFEKVCAILNEYNHNYYQLIPILEAVQEEYRYLPEEVMAFIAISLGISPANVFGVASFYSHFTFTPKGKYVIKVCDGTACHVKKSADIIKAMEEQLELQTGQRTTGDMLFTIETVSCLGACGLAPAIVINDEIVYGLLTPEKAVKLIKDIQAKEVPGSNEPGEH
ncbi:MAG: NAD(P)H-dependent oxidoreductase subunit E [Desulfotomaculaceae bacterium]|nr:NAD(P)H-dependent oxidoreductase subunit E [Desulfotomaculaceae bacterium]